MFMKNDGTRMISIAICRWHIAATSSKTGGYLSCRPFPDGNANESRRVTLHAFCHPTGGVFIYEERRDSNNLNATRMSVAGEGLTEPLLSCRPFPGGNANESRRVTLPAFCHLTGGVFYCRGDHCVKCNIVHTVLLPTIIPIPTFSLSTSSILLKVLENIGFVCYAYSISSVLR